MQDVMTPQRLATCDILLYHGTTWLSSAIRLFDGGTVSHASLVLEQGRVAEALGPGLVVRDLATSRAGATWVLARRLIAAPSSLRPVRQRAARFLREPNRYAYEQLVLLALLCLTRRLPLASGWQRFVRGVLDAAAARLESLAAIGAEPLICSEFVFRCFDEALPQRGDAFTIGIDQGPATRAARAGLRPRRAVRGRGRGVHPESLLARYGARAMASGVPAARGFATRGPRRATQVSVPNLAALGRDFAAYRDAIRTGRTALRAEGDAGLEAAMHRFALALAATPAHRRPRRKALAHSAWPALEAVAADFVTPGDLARSQSLFDLGILAASPRARRAPGKEVRMAARTLERRYDTIGQAWTQAGVRKALATIVAHLTPGVTATTIAASTRFETDLGWDEWALLRLVRPVRETLHQILPAASVRDLRTVGQLVTLVWDSMAEEAA